MATLVERYWQELRPSAAARLDLPEASVPGQRRRPRRRPRRELSRRAR
jgi:hypothetical protein